MKARDDDPMLRRWEDWRELSSLLRGEYTETVRSICGRLKISRATFVKYVRPNVGRIAYSSVEPRGRDGIGEKGMAESVWSRLLKAEGAIPESCTESTFYHAGEWEDLLRSSSRVERRTKRVPIENWIRDAEAWADAVGAYRDALAEADALLERREVGRIDHLALVVAAENGVLSDMERLLDGEGRLLWDARLSKTRRAEAAWEPAPDGLVDVAAADLQSLAEKKGYGGIDEQAYREWFAEGALRVTIELPDADGAAGRIVRYVDDPAPIEPRRETYLLEKDVIVPAGMLP